MAKQLYQIILKSVDGDGRTMNDCVLMEGEVSNDGFCPVGPDGEVVDPQVTIKVEKYSNAEGVDPVVAVECAVVRMSPESSGIKSRIQ